MKQVLCFMLLLSCLVFSGCVSTPPIAMDNGIHRKLITRCDNDVFCFKKPLYDVTWDSWGCGVRDQCNGADYPVSYRSNQYIYADDPNGYALTLPAGGNVMMLQENTEGAVNE